MEGGWVILWGFAPTVDAVSHRNITATLGWTRLLFSPGTSKCHGVSYRLASSTDHVSVPVEHKCITITCELGILCHQLVYIATR